jgi:hypothetical protein
MKKRKVNFIELIKKNKEQIWNDKEELRKIEERIDAKHAIIKTNNA